MPVFEAVSYHNFMSIAPLAGFSSQPTRFSYRRDDLLVDKADYLFAPGDTIYFTTKAG